MSRDTRTPRRVNNNFAANGWKRGDAFLTLSRGKVNVNISYIRTRINRRFVNVFLMKITFFNHVQFSFIIYISFKCYLMLHR